MGDGSADHGDAIVESTASTGRLGCAMRFIDLGLGQRACFTQIAIQWSLHRSHDVEFVFNAGAPSCDARDVVAPKMWNEQVRMWQRSLIVRLT